MFSIENGTVAYTGDKTLRRKYIEEFLKTQQGYARIARANKGVQESIKLIFDSIKTPETFSDGEKGKLAKLIVILTRDQYEDEFVLPLLGQSAVFNTSLVRPYRQGVKTEAMTVREFKSMFDKVFEQLTSMKEYRDKNLSQREMLEDYYLIAGKDTARSREVGEKAVENLCKVLRLDG